MVAMHADKNNSRAMPVKSVAKALHLLERIAIGDPRREGVTLSALATEFGGPVNSIHNLLKTLVACDYLALQGRGRYVAGGKFDEMQHVATFAHPGTRDRLLRVLQHFVSDENEGCTCVILAGAQRLVVGGVDSSQAIRVSQSKAESSPFFAKATGRLLAAMADERTLERIVEHNGMPGDLWNGIEDWTGLRKALTRIRAQGFCELEERQVGLVSLACPLLESTGRCWGVLGTYAPQFRCPPDRRPRLRQRLCLSAHELSEALMIESPQKKIERKNDD